jgi:hypothetical protein
MADSILIHKNRTNIISVALGFDVSNDTITSEIRDKDLELIAEFDVSFASDGSDGELILTLDDEQTSEITQVYGYMDLKRFSGGEPLSVFESPLEVIFQEVITE